MRQVGLAVILVLVVSCGGGGGADTTPDARSLDATAPNDAPLPIDAPMPIDAPPPIDAPAPLDAAPPIDAPDACDPVAQTGCSTGEKCTWINIDTQDRLGVIGCVADGSAASGTACVVGADGTTTGFDDCVAGDICVGGTCEVACTTTPDSCDVNSACAPYSNIFIGTPQLGACDYRCDPVTQTRTYDNAADCGGTTFPADGSKGCYLTTNGFTCAGVPAVVRSSGSYVHQQQAYGPTADTYYANGCAPGYVPLFYDPTFAYVVCIAMCAPHTTDTLDTTAPGGVSPHACSDRGANSAECRFYWIYESVDPPVYQDVGLCVDYASYGAPSCTTIDPTADNLNADGTAGADGIHDYLQLGCAAYGSP